MHSIIISTATQQNVNSIIDWLPYMYIASTLHYSASSPHRRCRRLILKLACNIIVFNRVSSTNYHPFSPTLFLTTSCKNEHFYFRFRCFWFLYFYWEAHAGRKEFVRSLRSIQQRLPKNPFILNSSCESVALATHDTILIIASSLSLSFSFSFSLSSSPSVMGLVHNVNPFILFYVRRTQSHCLCNIFFRRLPLMDCL